MSETQGKIGEEYWLREEHQGFREEFEILREGNPWLREISLRNIRILRKFIRA